MSAESGAQRDPARLSETSRVEAFSDGVLAIVITLLVIEVRPPETQHGHLLLDLLAQWPAYLAYLTSFAYVGVIWLNHHALFNRIRRVDKGLNLANLVLLLTTAFLPFPTAVLADAIQEGDPANMSVAAALYALVAGLMCASWLLIFGYLSRRPGLLAGVDASFYRYGFAGAIAFVTPVIVPLLTFLALPAFYYLTSHGMRGGPDRSG
jgi:uncharacterized membrane protein